MVRRKKRKGKGRRRYSPEFKAEAVRMVIETDQTIASVARDLGVSHGALRIWVQKAEERGGDLQGVTPAEREELLELRKEIRKLKQERDILKKSVAFFVTENS